MSNITFNTQYISVAQQGIILEQARELCYEWYVEKADHSKNYGQNRSRVYFKEISSRSFNI